MEYKIILVLLVIIAILFILLIKTFKKNREIEFNKRSIASKYGKMTEQFMPFIEEYPYDPQQFRFIGTPIDGIQFDDDKIVFIEFKTAKSRLNNRQKNVQYLINKGKVSFEEHRLDG